MLSKKPSIALCAYSTLQSLPSSCGSSTSSVRRHESTRHQRMYRGSERRYATVAGGHEDHHEPQQDPPKMPEHVWPTPLRGQAHLTPYQIFAMERSGVYSKARFYELVKIYHPDLNKAAHGILSDPVKRSAYDRFGAGWNGRADVPSGRSGSHDEAGPFTQSSWTGEGDPIWRNATWEDWERYYDRKGQGKGDSENFRTPQAPVYMRHSFFLSLVTLLAIVGNTVIYNRAEDAGTYFVEQRDLVHDRAAKELRKVKQEISALKDREQRIQWFTRQREATLGNLTDAEVESLRNEKAERVFSDREVCGTENLPEK